MPTGKDPGTSKDVKVYYAAADDETDPKTLASVIGHFAKDANEVRCIETPDVAVADANEDYTLTGEDTQRTSAGVAGAISTLLQLPASTPEANDKGQTVAKLAPGTEFFMAIVNETGSGDSVSQMATWLQLSMVRETPVYAPTGGGVSQINVSVSVLDYEHFLQ